MAKLIIDTTDSKTTKIMLEAKDQISSGKDLKSQNALSLIDRIIGKNSLKLKDISEIEVKPGPGSFTGIRVGIAIANSLGFALGVSVNGKELAEPIYK